MPMASKTNNTSNTLLIAIVVVLCIIFMANSWVSGEIEGSQKITAPATVSTQPTRLNNALRNKNLAQTESALTDEDQEIQAEQIGSSPAPKKKRQKIIYEIPLDDVNLVQ